MAKLKKRGAASYTAIIMKKTNTHGGARPNAGRKPRFNEPTKVVQITLPISRVEEFKQRAELILRDFEPLKCGNDNPPCAGNLKHGYLECALCDWSER